MDALIETLPSRGRRYGETPEALERRLREAWGVGGAMSYTDFLRRGAAGEPVKTALIFGDRRYSYAEVFDAIDDVAAALGSRCGVRPGQRVALMLGNSDHYYFWYLGVLASGAVAVPLNTLLVGREIAYQLKDSEAVLLVVQERFLEQIAAAEAELGRSLPKLVVERDPFPHGAREQGRPPAPDVHAPAAIYYTSGTTGAPKGCLHTHYSLIAVSAFAPETFEFDSPEVRFLVLTPLFHIAAHVFFLNVLRLGGTLVVDSYDTARTFRLIEQHRINAFFAVPSILLLMAQSPLREQHDMSSVRVVQFGAAPMAIERLQAVQDLFPNAGLAHGYGQTETAGLISILSSDDAFRKIGSVGLAVPGCEFRIVDGEGRPLAARKVGEVAMRGPHMMREYINRPEATAETIRDGWLMTGDVGFTDEDGYLFLVDRAKDMIIRGGENIYSTEVEDAIYAHDDVSLAAVIGRPHPIFGEEVCALVVPRGGARIDLAGLQEHCRAWLAPYKLPTALYVMPEFPLTATGKIQKQELKRMLREGVLDAEPAHA